MSTRTRLTTFKHLADQGELGTILVRLMMVINDLGLANDGVEAWHNVEEPHRKARQAGAKMYFIRVQFAHLREALHIINRIKITPELMAYVDRSEKKTQESFHKAAAFIGTEEYKQMKAVRDKITFHYDHDIILTCLEKLSTKHPNVQLPVTMGSRTLDWYCEPSDRIIDNAVVRDIFGIADDADLNAEVDKIVVRLQEIGEQLADFAGNFIFEHIGRL